MVPTDEEVISNQLKISWAANRGSDGAEITGYIVYWGITSEAEDSFSMMASVSSLPRSYVITNLVSGTRYKIAVAAVNRSGTGRRSTSIEVRTFGAEFITAGGSHSCVVYNDAAWCWGANEFGQIGRRGYFGSRSATPTLVPNLDSGVTAISAGINHTCAIQDAAAKCWGLNFDGQLGDNSEENSSTPVQVLRLSGGVTAISAGNRHSCAVQRGVAWCWGRNTKGQLGNGSRSDTRRFTAVQVVGLGSDVTAIVTGNEYSCAIQDAAAKCWGFNFDGQLGDGEGMDSSTPVQVDGLSSSVTAIAANDSTACAVQDGEAWCWGSGDDGQLGDGAGMNSSTPVRVEGLSSATLIAVGGFHSCAIQRGAARCWGSNGFGRLGIGSTVSQSTVPVLVQGLDSDVTAIGAGNAHSCAIRYGVIKCWGAGSEGRLGNGIILGGFSTRLPLLVIGLSFAPPSQLRAETVTGDSIEVSWSPLILATDVPAITRYLISWGTDLEDEEGLSTTSVSVPTTSYVISGLRAEITYQIAIVGVSRVGIGNRSTLTIQTTQAVLPPSAPQNLRLDGVTTDTIVVSWERPNFDGGELPTYTISWASTPVSGVSTVVSIAASENDYEITGLLPNRFYYIVVTAVNSFGPGVGSSITLQTAALPAVPPIVMVPTDEDIISYRIKISWEAAPSRGPDGAEITGYIVYWSSSPEVEDSFSMASVPSLQTSYVFTNLASGTRYKISVATVNRSGAGRRSTPIEVRTFGAGSITAGGSHSCVVYNEAAWCWGDNAEGQLGRGDTGEIFLTFPRVVRSLNDGVIAIEAGNSHTCAIRNGKAWCWGLGGNGQLGDGTRALRNAPVGVSGLDGDVTAISAGSLHTCAIQRGAAWCWGNGESGRLGDGGVARQLRAVKVNGLNSGVTAISAGDQHSCAIVNATARCWGRGDEGQLGGSYAGSRTAREVDGLSSGVTSIAAGGFHSCAVVNATARCWGRGDEGQLGDTHLRDSFSPVKVVGLSSGVTAISAGFAHNCAIVNRAARCWGWNRLGQLGRGSNDERGPVAVEVIGLDDGVTEIAAGGFREAKSLGHSCAIHYGFTKCWGENFFGQLGDLSRRNTNVPVDVEGLSPLKAPSQLRAGTVTGDSIAVSWSPLVLSVPAITGYLISWGTDLEDKAGLRTTSVSVPTTSYVISRLRAETSYQIAVAGVNRVGIGNRVILTLQTAQARLFLSAPQNLGINGVTTDAIVVSWELPNFDDGDPVTAYTISWVSTPVSGVSTVVSIAASENDNESYEITGLLPNRFYHIVVTAANSVGFGVGSSITTQTAALLPVPPIVMVPTDEDVASNQLRISWEASSKGNDGAEITGYIVYWGTPSEAEDSFSMMASVSSLQTSYVITNLASGTRYKIAVAAVNRSGAGRRSTPFEVRTFGARSITAGSVHSCAVYNDAAWCWGSNTNGRLGVGRPISHSLIPVLVQGLDSGVTAISTLLEHTCAVQNGAAKCWGLGNFDQLGVAGVFESSVSLSVPGFSSGVTTIGTGRRHSCVLQRGGAWCWGFGGNGELGDGTGSNIATGVQVLGLDSAVTVIDVGESYTCAIQAGAAWCWGVNSTGQLGNDDSSGEPSLTPVQVEGLDGDVTAISAGDQHSCAVQRGIAWCWGNNNRGQLGNSTTTSSNSPVKVDGLGRDSSVTVITVGDEHSCAVQRGAAWCWGYNEFDQLGSGSSGGQNSTPVSVRGLDNGVTAIAAGSRHTCAIQYGVIKCWGSGGSGQLGLGGFGKFNIPKQLTGLSFAPPSQLRAGTVTGHSIAVSWSPLVLGVPAITSYLISWGTDLEDEEGLRTTSVSVPTTSYVISELRAETTYQIAVAGVNRIGIGNRSTLTLQTGQVEFPPSAPQNLRLDGVTTDTIVVSWERPNFDGGELTTYTISWDVSIPIIGVSTAVSIAASENDYKITGLLPNRFYHIVVTAANSRGPGAGASITPQAVALLPVPPIVIVPTDEDVVSNQLKISWEASSRGSDGAEITGYIVYWGTTSEAEGSFSMMASVSSLQTSYVITNLVSGARYKIAVATVNRSGTGRRSTPFEVRTFGARSIATGDAHSCAIYSDAVRCWGSNEFGQLGRGYFGGSRSTPGLVPGLDRSVTAISSSGDHTCVIQDGAAKCWGWGESGQLGGGGRASNNTPVEVQTLSSGVTAIATGTTHSCAIVNGAAKCWGAGINGELGRVGIKMLSLSPVQVDGLDNNVTAISAGDAFSCAIHDGAAKCWGFNGDGQLGEDKDITSVVSDSAVAVQGLGRGVTAISAGFAHTCAIRRGVAWCWGNGEFGQRGDDSVMEEMSSPVRVQGLGSSVTMIATGEFHSCAVQRGAAWCWGSNGFAQLGSGSAVSRSSVPVSVRGLDNGVTAIAAGDQHTCAIHYGVIKCWGSGDSGQLGTGGFGTFDIPEPLTGLSFAPPSQLRAGTITGNSIAVSWSPLVLGVRAITSYLISWGTNLDDEEGLRTTSVSVPTTSYVISELRAETILSNRGCWGEPWWYREPFNADHSDCSSRTSFGTAGA